MACYTGLATRGFLHEVKNAWLLSFRIQHAHCCVALVSSVSRSPAGLLLCDIDPDVHTVALQYSTFLFIVMGSPFTKHIHIKYVS